MKVSLPKPAPGTPAWEKFIDALMEQHHPDARHPNEVRALVDEHERIHWLMQAQARMENAKG